MNNRLKKIALLGGDIIILYASLYFTLLIRYFNADLLTIHLWPFSIIFLLWLIIFYIANLYNLNLAVNNFIFFQISSKALIIASLTSIAFFYLLPNIGIAPKRILFIYIIVFSLLFYLWRQFYNWSLKAYLPKNKLAIIGCNKLVKELIDELQKKPHLGYIISLIADDTNENISINNIPIIKNLVDLPKLIKKDRITSIIFTIDPHQSPELRTALFNCLPLKINYFSLPDFYEIITGKIPLEAIDQMWFLEKLNESNKIWFDCFKKFYDFFLALIILLITLPFWLIIAIIIKTTNPGPVFFIMQRLGKNGKIFKLIKFRTMNEKNNDYSPTCANDPRITKFGSFLRKTRIDELPQLLNIIKGEMSFVGPRPERPELATELTKQIPFYNERLLIKPGLSGSDQVSGEYHSPSKEDSLKKLQYDLFYIKNRSVYLDLSIILKTIATVISRSGI
ncbi:MAG: sugar transferase [Patescibacteria group bacterium]|nr:sugar transferase [Patescibacteria group bacterium]MBU0879431.1 sugar transferase [Patescibacteria group bacterium]MBU0880517.1 sugar transferase [Patescibacteria group bacterium]MBU1062858.1 sugar transferase [Patescibacteria group bacterium]MBU1783513.1 sugar transferase [Patescibacteria group bacterium]